ncbi:prenyltransferase/squalene oxidase repeat-containing protein [Streptomyces sp. NPDC001941]|uniref:prenyltransferase/squalene oxidase repeat-containing protein n=1 Tax=Streptomyces sp. NPDC001941 TaxID=3154659 RepID=UPI00331CEFC5
MFTVRRSATALAAGAVLGAVGAASLAPAAYAAPSPTPSPSVQLPTGLYGTTDPTYDGVWRQSLAFMAQRTTGVKPAQEALDWLVGQQCASGGFPAYRADASKACTPDTFLDVNATAVAVTALTGFGPALPSEEPSDGPSDGATPSASSTGAPTDPVGAALVTAVDWLKGNQNKDGGWGSGPGAPSDANSTSLVIGALAAAGQRPGSVKSVDGRTPYDALLTFALPCTDKTAPGAFAFQPKDGKLTANDDATAAAVLGGLGKGLSVRGVDPSQPVGCETPAKPTAERAARNGASYLAGVLTKSDHLAMPPMPGAADSTPQPDTGNTADAVVALGASGHKDKAAAAFAWLKRNGVAWAEKAGPAAWAQLVFAAQTMGTDPRAFGDVDLVERLNATGPKPESRATSSTDAEEAIGPREWVGIGAGVVAIAGLGFLLAGRRKGQQ